MCFLLFFIILLPHFAFCSGVKNTVMSAKKFFDQQLSIKAMSTADGLQVNSEDTVEKLIINTADNLARLYGANRPYAIHNFNNANSYNLVTISIILLGAAKIKNKYENIFDFLEQVGLCSKLVGNFGPTLLQVFLWESVKLESNTYKLLTYKNYKDKLFEIIMTYYVVPQDIKYLQTHQDQLKKKQEENLKYAYLLQNINLFLTKIPRETKSVSPNNKNYSGNSQRSLNSKGKNNSNSTFLLYILTYIPYVSGSALFLYFFYFLIKKQLPKN